MSQESPPCPPLLLLRECALEAYIIADKKLPDFAPHSGAFMAYPIRSVYQDGKKYAIIQWYDHVGIPPSYHGLKIRIDAASISWKIVPAAPTGKFKMVALASPKAHKIPRVEEQIREDQKNKMLRKREFRREKEKLRKKKQEEAAGRKEAPIRKFVRLSGLKIPRTGMRIKMCPRTGTLLR